MKNLFLFVCFFSALTLGCNPKERTSYVLEETELVPEGIAYSEKRNMFYLSSVAKSKIISVNAKTGEQKDFIKSNEYGFMPGVGILIDDQRNLLFAISGYGIKDSLTSLFTFDLESKKLLYRYNLKNTKGNYFLNDLVSDKKGTLYITNSNSTEIYTLKPDSDSLQLFFKSEEIEYSNGIAISDDNTKLYVASFAKGVRSIDIKSKSVLNEADSMGTSQGIDGLEFYNGHLYAVQNGVRANSDNFRKLVLSPSQSKIVDVQVIDSNNKDLKIPLTFCIMGEKAVVIGNSNLEHLNQKTLTFSEPDALQKTKLLIYNLKEKRTNPFRE